MQVLVDTCIWSEALRRVQVKSPHVIALQELIIDHRVCMIGPIRQEILSGIRQKEHFQSLRDYLSAFPDLPIESADYECAAEFSNLLRSKGVQGSAIDFIICAVAHRYSLQIYTADNDFDYFAQHLPIQLYISQKKH
jgi:predicted nucleic acid-binding protein